MPRAALRGAARRCRRRGGRQRTGPTGRPSSMRTRARAAGGLDEPEAEQRQRGSDRERRGAREARCLAARLDAEDAGRVEEEGLQERDQQRDRDDRPGRSRRRAGPLDVHPPGRREDLAPAPPAGEAERSGGPPGRARDQEDHEQARPASTRPNATGLRTSRTSALEPVLDGAAEEVGRAGPEDAARRDRVAPLAPALRPARSARSTAVFRFGPVGPLKNACCSSPQRPSNAIHGKPPAPARGSLGIVFTAGRSSTCGPRVSSQPTPCSAELPR